MEISWVKPPMNEMSILAAEVVVQLKGLMLVSKATKFLEAKFALDMFLKEMIQTTGQV